jgi:hypothetical protein
MREPNYPRLANPNRRRNLELLSRNLLELEKKFPSKDGLALIPNCQIPVVDQTIILPIWRPQAMSMRISTDSKSRTGK